jgi:tRNA pseudouridine38-40 synthase
MLAAMSKFNYRLLVQYDGTNYSGWQIQPRLPSIQGVMKAAIEKVTRESVTVTGSGRTDAGVHARGQVANFRCGLQMAPEAWLRALNALLPADIRVLRAARAPSAFHAQHDAQAKIYRYYIFTGPILPPWESRYSWHWPRPLQFEEMQKAAALLLGRHDMRSFTTSGSTVKEFVRHVIHSQFQVRKPHLIYRIEADGFLQHMVRSIVGTLIEVGSGRFTVADFGSILAACDRRKAGRTAPPQGLFLERVRYRYCTDMITNKKRLKSMR